ncbi:hypothetical protein LBMAG52_36980 [Planctomycetia bacterium]|nr:hypothetical protein LBMAG52_36980 [Planctomycetia bacterium]
MWTTAKVAIASDCTSATELRRHSLKADIAAPCLVSETVRNAIKAAQRKSLSRSSVACHKAVSAVLAKRPIRPKAVAAAQRTRTSMSPSACVNDGTAADADSPN